MIIPVFLMFVYHGNKKFEPIKYLEQYSLDHKEKKKREETYFFWFFKHYL